MQDPNADTEWNDVLRAKGIIPPKEEKELTEEDIVSMVESTIQQKSQGSTKVHQVTHTLGDRSKRESSGKGSTINLGSLIPVFPPTCFRIVIFMTIIVLCDGMTNHPVIKPKNLAACSNINGPCPLPGSWNEMFMRKHCYFCQEGGNAYCIDDRSTNKLFYICITEEEMKCEAGYYGRFSFIELHGLQKIQYEKLTCSTGTHVRNRRDCRRTCEVNDRINKSIFTVQVPQQIDGTPALLTCNIQQNLCPINPQYGEVFPYSLQLEYEDVCGAIGKDCLSAKLEPSIEERIVESIPLEDIATSPASVTPDTTLAPDTIWTTATKSVQGNTSIVETTSTTENTPLLGQDPTNLGTTVTKNKDGSEDHSIDAWVILICVMVSKMLILMVVGLIRKFVWRRVCNQKKENAQLNALGTTITTITVEKGGHCTYIDAKKVKYQKVPSADNELPETVFPKLMNSICCGRTSPADSTESSACTTSDHESE